MKIPSFYIENFRHNGEESELEILLKNGTEKIVFRLFRQSEELLSLVAFSGKKNHKKFSEGIEMKLNVYSSGNEVDLTNLQVFLGDMEIGSKKDSTGNDPVSVLRKMIRKPKAQEKYLIIEPVMPEPGDRYVHYELFTLPDLEQQYRAVSTASRLKTNPSPPFDGY